MRLIKPIYFSAILGLALTGCGASKVITSAAPITNIDNIALKNAPLSDSNLKRWSHLDIIKDTVPGMSVDKAYAELLKNKKGVKVVVGVVDSGVDIDHEDLKSIIWVNKNEIPGNGIDDDNNGFIDDVHGWNFLGNVSNENLEIVRLIKKGDDGSQAYKDAKALYDKDYAEALGNKQQLDFILNADKAIRDNLKKDNYTLEDVKAILTRDATLGQAKMVMAQVLSKTDKAKFDKEIEGFKDHVYDQLNYNLNLQFEGRKGKALDKNPDDITDNKYGNNNVTGPDKKDAKHGTHVSGIIAGIRNNGKGGDGVANNVEIMAVRAVPNGDEYDKDIALALRYAVDNGAKVINTSFGKYYSPHKEWVYDAIKYAGEKDVLIVNAAGNEGYDLNTKNVYPNDSENMGPEVSNTFLTVGALNVSYGSNLVADFSNYGTYDVDVFAPGVEIYSTTPNDTYEFLQGTSMAAPNVAGVAALIRSYYPTLTAAQVKQIIMESGIPTKIEVALDGDKSNKRSFAEVSKTGRMVNAYNALILAEKMTNTKK
ncbi:S8 family peptidase [Flavobacterium sp. '19STA2R22 D10 B1']|uniref:S8 family peptidase n=1 Tax=Flavobacterium aerium TaxID=3037261 RepID=UPI00278BE1E8|nr:S8 family peptidase [Flavobacterium sp. '19STA2R22 D10 B1']